MPQCIEIYPFPKQKLLQIIKIIKQIFVFNLILELLKNSQIQKKSSFFLMKKIVKK
jgi:hypothetical protein